MRIKQPVLAYCVYLISVGCIGFVTAAINKKGCGIRGDKGQIVGGKKSSSKYPWMAAIFVNESHTCGGSVIDERHILTAVHCFESANDPKAFTVRVAELEQGESGKSYKVEDVQMHDNFDPKKFENDIAIIRLKDSLPKDVVPICVTDKNTPNDGDTLTITGYGVTKQDDAKNSKKLQEINLKAITNKKCDKIVKSVDKSVDSGLTENQFCSGDSKGGKGVCLGDSGGPASMEQDDGHFIVVGVISHVVFKCAMKGISGMYTKVHPYVKWIEETIKKKEFHKKERFET